MLFFIDRPIEDQLSPITRSFALDGIGNCELSLPTYLWDVLDCYSVMTTMLPATTVQVFGKHYGAALDIFDEMRAKYPEFPPASVRDLFEFDLHVVITRMKNLRYKPANDHDRHADTGKDKTLGVWKPAAIRSQAERSHQMAGRLRAMMGDSLFRRHAPDRQAEHYAAIQSALEVASKKVWTVGGLAGLRPSARKAASLSLN